MEAKRQRDESLKGLVGKHLIYTYDNGWQYEIYVKNANTFCYRIHSGIVGGRWVTDQKVFIVRLADNIFQIFHGTNPPAPQSALPLTLKNARFMA